MSDAPRTIWVPAHPDAEYFIARTDDKYLLARVFSDERAAIAYHHDDVVRELREALEGMLTSYTDLANSGDAGFWDCETEQEVIAARAALAKLAD